MRIADINGQRLNRRWRNWRRTAALRPLNNRARQHSHQGLCHRRPPLSLPARSGHRPRPSANPGRPVKCLRSGGRAATGTGSGRTHPKRRAKSSVHRQRHHCPGHVGQHRRTGHGCATGCGTGSSGGTLTPTLQAPGQTPGQFPGQAATPGAPSNTTPGATPTASPSAPSGAASGAKAGAAPMPGLTVTQPGPQTVPQGAGALLPNAAQFNPACVRSAPKAGHRPRLPPRRKCRAALCRWL